MVNDRVKICLRCKEFVPIYPDNPNNLEELKRFQNKHYKHMLVNISVKELSGKVYERFVPAHRKRNS